MKSVACLALAAGAFLLQVDAARACTYRINKDNKTAELAAVVVAEKSGGSPDVTVDDPEVVRFRYFESKPTPMCPEEITYVARFNVSSATRDPKTGKIRSRCVTEVEITKVEPWTEESVATYSIKDVRPPRCTR